MLMIEVIQIVVRYSCYLGNDLARALKWGGGYTGEKVMQMLYAVEDANAVPFDRYKCTCTYNVHVYYMHRRTGYMYFHSRNFPRVSATNVLHKIIRGSYFTNL